MVRIFILVFMVRAGLSAQMPVADQTFKVDGTHEFAFAFAEGDMVDLQIRLIAGRALKVVEFLQYPDQSLFRSYELDTALNQRITIPQTGMYFLRISEKGIGKKICRFVLHRTPGQEAFKRLDTRITWDWKNNGLYQIARRPTPAGKKTEAIPIAGSVTVSASKLGIKKSSSFYQFTLPANTVRWAYRLAVGQAAIEARRKDADKATGALKNAGAKLLGYEPQSALAIYALGLAIDLTVSTAGEDVQYAILDGTNLPKYLNGEPYESFIFQPAVSVDVQRRYTPLEGVYFFGLRNNNWFSDIDVQIDIEAITETPLFEYEMFLEPLRP